MFRQSQNIPVLLKLDSKDIPYGLIEVNRRCNLGCPVCFNKLSNYSKPVDLIKKEIDLLCKKRNVMTLGIMGGEPTLHEDLPTILKYAASKVETVKLLTNGLLITEELLRSYKQAGLSEIEFHIDCMQPRPGFKNAQSEKELNSLRIELAKTAEKLGITCGFVLTVCKNALSSLHHVVTLILSTPGIRGALLSTYADMSDVQKKFKSVEMFGKQYNVAVENQDWIDLKQCEDLKDQRVKLVEVESVLSKLGMNMWGYIPSNKNDNEKRLAMYCSFSLIKSNTGQYDVIHMPPSFGSFFYRLLRIQKSVFGKYPNITKSTSKKNFYLLFLFTLFCFDIAIIKKVTGFLIRALTPHSNIYLKTLEVEQPPNITEDGDVEYCNGCPGVSIRNNELMPVCLADILSPLPKLEQKYED